MSNKPAKPSALFILSVDTEEEWNWDDEFPQFDFTVSNAQQIPAFQGFCSRLGIRPSYFVDHAIASNDKAAGALRLAHKKNQCEIGAHLHPWCNPPYFGKTTEFESHVVNLPIEQVTQKLDALVTILQQQFQITPTSFRTGRWGINSEVLTLLVERGFLVDSSVYPFYDNEYFSCQGSPLTPYWPDLASPLSEGSQRQLLEIPVTAGFNRQNFERSERIFTRFNKPLMRHLHLIGSLWHTRLLRKLYLSPELTTAEDMIRLVNASLARGNAIIHMYLHSSSLIDGVTGLLDSNNAFETITSRIQTVVKHCESKLPLDFATATEAYYQFKAADYST